MFEASCPSRRRFPSCWEKGKWLDNDQPNCVMIPIRVEGRRTYIAYVQVVERKDDVLIARTWLLTDISILYGHDTITHLICVHTARQLWNERVNVDARLCCSIRGFPIRRAWWRTTREREHEPFPRFAS
jgi:hypothetical protein